MKILMQIRRDAFSKGGGDLIQLLKTKEALAKLGLSIDVSDRLAPSLEGYDLAHLFNLSVVEDTYEQALNAYRQKKPIVLSSIYWDKNEYLLNNPNFKVKLAEKFLGESITKYLMKKRRYYAVAWHKQRSVLKMADIVIASSEREVGYIKDNFSYYDFQYATVPLGVDEDVFRNASPERFIKKYKIKDFVLCVGRIEDLKNQIRIIKAVDGNFPLVFVGSKNYFFKSYVEQFEKEIATRPDILYIENMPQNEIADAYAAARVCVGASWFETFHLASLEALSVGTPVVATVNSPLNEYFKDNIFYCEPGNVGSIRQALDKAMALRKRSDIAELVLKKFNWMQVAEKTKSVYIKLYNDKHHHHQL